MKEAVEQDPQRCLCEDVIDMIRENIKEILPTNASRHKIGKVRL